jgi:hypothetical protein
MSGGWRLDVDAMVFISLPEPRAQEGIRLASVENIDAMRRSIAE